MTPNAYKYNVSCGIAARHVKTCANSKASPIFATTFTPNGQRLITGSLYGEFTIWNALAFNFETILEAHNSKILTMKWSHNSKFMISGDEKGIVKYWQSNMNSVKVLNAQRDAIRMLSFSPTDELFVSASDDGNVCVWDFERCGYKFIYHGEENIKNHHCYNN